MPYRRRKPELRVVAHSDEYSPVGAKAPLISVIIPVYNEEGIIESSVIALREGLRETGWSFEILLAENGSRDRTVELCRSLSNKYDEVRFFSISEPNYGAALKEGILRATGVYVVCDEIDLCDLGFYRRAVERLMNDDAAMVVGVEDARGRRRYPTRLPPRGNAGL